MADEKKPKRQKHHKDCGEVGETGEHGELGTNAADAERGPSAEDLDNDAAEKDAKEKTA